MKRPSGPTIRHAVFLGAAAVLLVLALGARAEPEKGPKSALPQKQIVLVLPFENSTGKVEYDPLAENMDAFFIAAISQSKTMACVERAALDRILDEHKISLASLANVKNKVKVGKLVGAKYVVTGGFTIFKKTLKINAHLIEVETTRIARSASDKGNIEKILDVIQGLAEKLTKSRIRALSNIETTRIERFPRSRLHFARGMGYYYAGMFDFATVEFMKALALVFDYPEARYWNARCYFDDGEWEHAKIELGKFLKHFPKSNLAGKAKELLKKCEKRIRAKKQRKSGDQG